MRARFPYPPFALLPVRARAVAARDNGRAARGSGYAAVPTRSWPPTVARGPQNREDGSVFQILRVCGLATAHGCQPGMQRLAWRGFPHACGTW